MIERKLLKDSDRNLMFPDVASNGKIMVCCYIETRNHMDRTGTVLHFLRSDDFGQTWKNDTEVISKLGPGGHISPLTGRFYNSPRIISTISGFIVVVDSIPLATIGPDFLTDYGDMNDLHVSIFSSDDGKNWDEINTKVRGICPSICQVEEGYLIVTQLYDPIRQRRSPHVWMIDSMGRSEFDMSSILWDVKINTLNSVDLCEACIIDRGDVFVMIMRSTSIEGRSSYRSISKDKGRTWSDPEPFCLPGGAHRPTIIKLSSGDYFASFRFYPGNGYDQNTFMAFMPSYTLTAPRHQQRAFIRPLDYNDNPLSDQGYTGACELPNGIIFVVNYMNPIGIRTSLYCYIVTLNDFSKNLMISNIEGALK